MKYLIRLSALLVCITPLSLVANPVVEQLLQDYKQQSPDRPTAAKGKSLWVLAVRVQGVDEKRSCTRCHGDSLANDGQHAKTGKTIKPMSPIVNARRYTDAQKIEKWFRRNCKWTWGRECTADEKASFLLYLTTSTD
ncbi:MAG: DUF1924 domain-containing protein [Gammaproteobacteria bacterium]|nr:DUF1924 domain-containing protein [Gammaproteobacteria bacterium]